MSEPLRPGKSRSNHSRSPSPFDPDQTGSSNANLTLDPQSSNSKSIRKKNRLRPKSYHNRSPNGVNSYSDTDFKDHDAYNSLSLLDNAAEHQDFNAIKEGLKFALGTEDGGSHWLPNTTSKQVPELTVNTDAGDTSQNEDQSILSHPNLSSSSVLPGRTSPNPMGDFLNPKRTPASPYPRQNETDLEKGLNTPAISVHSEFPDSPAKFTDIITRVSDRIAGTGAGATLGVELSSKKSRDDGSLRSFRTHSSRNSSRSDLHLSPSVSNISQSTGVEVTATEIETMHAGPSVEEFGQSPQETTFHTNQAPKIPVKNVAFVNEPLAQKATPSTLNIKKIWQSDASTMYLFGKSLGYFDRQNSFRQRCHYVLSLKATNTFFLVLLLLQTVLLSVRHWHPKEDGYYLHGYNGMDYFLIVVNVIYTFEMIAKSVAYGFIDDKVMFTELRLPYPENEIKKKVFKGSSLKSLWQRLLDNFNFLIEKPKKFYNNRKIDPVVEIELQDQPNPVETQKTKETLLQQKYNISSHHNDSTLDESREYTSHDAIKSNKFNNIDRSNSTIELNSDDPAGLSSQKRIPTRIQTTNTFLKPQAGTDVDKLQLRRAYLRNSWHRIDFVSIIMFWISLFLSINHFDAKHNIMVFRALSCLRILRLCNLTTGTSTILKALKLAVPQLVDVSIFIGCFGLFFGILGVQSFKTSFSRHCVWYNPDDPDDTWINDDSYCGSYLTSEGVTRPYLYSNGHHSSSIKGFRCPANSKCVSGENPYFDSVSFDNIFNSLELVYVIMTANTFTDLMYYTMDSDGLVACLFFIACLFIMTVWLLNIFVAIIVTSFNLTRLGDSANKETNQIEGVFGPVSAPVSMHKEIIDDLKKQSVWLAIYYKLEFFFPMCIVADLSLQCVRTANEPRQTDHILYRIEVAFTILFLIEILTRFVLYLPKWRVFFKLRRNMFDLFLAVVTSVIIIEPIKVRLGQVYYWMTVFQIMRCYRIILVSRFTRSLWLKIFGNLRQLIDLTVFLFLLTYLTSVIYARFFEGSISEEEAEEEDLSFTLQTIPNTFVGLYTITSTENWTGILYPLQGHQKNMAAKAFTGILLIGWFFISNFVILNIFIAVIANTLIVPEAEKKRRQLLQFIQNITESIHSVDSESGALSRFKNKFFNRKGSKEQLQMAVVSLLLSGTAVTEFLDTQEVENQADDEVIKELPKNKILRFFKVNFRRFKSSFNNPFKTKARKIDGLAAFDPTNYAKDLLQDRKDLIDAQNKYLKDNPSYNRVFYVMGPRHKIRRFCQRIVNSSHGERIDGAEPHKRVSDSFTIIMFLWTLVLVITACYLTPLIRSNIQESRGMYSWTFWLDIGLVCIFTIEFCIRVIADGFCFTPNAYCRSSWNIIDFIVLISLWFEFVAYLKNYGDLSRFIRGFKALRALRILTISETAKNNFHNTMISGIGNILSAALMSLCLLIPFSIWGLNVFHGRLDYCLDGVSGWSQCMNEYSAEVFNWEVVSPNTYVEPLLNFNTFGKSFSALFEITSLEGWVDLLEDVMASTGVGTVPESFATPFNGFFVILFNFVGIVFILTLFISVIIHNYSLSTGRAYMTVDQRGWYQVKQFLLQVKPTKLKTYKDLGKFKQFCYRMTVEKHKVWNGWLNLMLVLLVLALLLEQLALERGWYVFRTMIFCFVGLSFTANAIMLMVAKGFKTFIRNKWLLFNFLVSVGSLATTLIGTRVSELSAFTNVNKLFLVGALALIIPKSDRLSQFLKFASASLPDLFSLLFTWLVLFLLFAIALNQIFGTTRIGPNGSGNINVRSVPKALILLFRCSFGEGWNYIMDDFKIEEPFCYSSDDTTFTDCGSKQYAYLLFICWNLVSMYIFLNMFVSLILDSFSYIMSKGDYAKLIERKEIRKFKKKWSVFDPLGTGYIKPMDLPKFLHSLDGSLSFHFYHGSLEIPVLCHRWFKRNDRSNPYDITADFDEIDKTVDSWDIEKIRERRKAYEMFIEEAMVTMELNNDPGISFKRILLQLPIYKSFDTSTCLNLIDFLERRLLLQKVNKRLNRNKVYETITAYIVRWKYLNDRRYGRTEVNDRDFEGAMKRRSYLSGQRSSFEQERFDEEFERDFGEQEKDQPQHLTTDVSRDFGRRSKVYDDMGDFEGNRDEKYGTDGYGTDDSEESGDNSHRRSGVYVPKSPLHTNRKNTKSPRMFLDVGDASRPQTPFFGLNPGSSSSIRDTDSLLDMDDVREGLQDSQWSDSLRDLKRDDRE